MQCTTCNSDNVQKLSVVYEQGTQNIKTTGRTRGGGVGFGGGGLGAGLGLARTTTKGTSQSIAAQKAAPPEKKKIAIPIMLIIGGLIAMGAIHMIVGLIMLAIGGFLFWKFSQYNKQNYPPLYSEWQNSWLCNKCGAVFVQ